MLAQPLLRQSNVVGMNIEADRISIHISGGYQRGATAHKGINHQFPLMREEFNTLTRQRNGIGSGMFCLIANITPFIAKLPYPQLAFNPIFRRQAITMSRFTLTGPARTNVQFPALYCYSRHPAIRISEHCFPSTTLYQARLVERYIVKCAVEFVVRSPDFLAADRY